MEGVNARHDLHDTNDTRRKKGDTVTGKTKILENGRSIVENGIDLSKVVNLLKNN